MYWLKKKRKEKRGVMFVQRGAVSQLVCTVAASDEAAEQEINDYFQ